MQSVQSVQSVQSDQSLGLGLVTSVSAPGSLPGLWGNSTSRLAMPNSSVVVFTTSIPNGRPPWRLSVKIVAEVRARVRHRVRGLRLVSKLWSR